MLEESLSEEIDAAEAAEILATATVGSPDEEDEYCDNTNTPKRDNKRKKNRSSPRIAAKRPLKDSHYETPSRPPQKSKKQGIGKFNSGGWDSFNRDLPWPHFLRLPGKLHLFVGNDARYHICSFLDYADLSNLKLVNKECHDLVKNRGG